MVGNGLLQDLSFTLPLLLISLGLLIPAFQQIKLLAKRGNPVELLLQQLFFYRDLFELFVYIPPLLYFPG